MTTDPLEEQALSKSPETGPQVSSLVILVKILSVVIVPIVGVYLLKLVLGSMGIIGH